ncbi:gamma-glutamylcyclotransferase family protein [Aquipuribacter sp. SD81]|uniref:gamma-glutamylcyclotransferase family protein n=1 Tax=Aquipuribacter sp. SD81 TaxID=3127703 RepID=UPI00301B1301
MTRVPHPPPVADRRLPLDLAVYGTLRRGCRNAHLLAGAEPLLDGVVHGALHEVAVPLGRDFRYPLLVVGGPGAAAAGLVRVEVHRVHDEPTLVALDALEAYDPASPATSEYVRVRVPLLDATGGATPHEVQVYAYAGHVDGLGEVLPGGDWCAHAGSAA